MHRRFDVRRCTAGVIFTITFLTAGGLAACAGGDRQPATEEPTPLSVPGNQAPSPPNTVELPGPVNDHGTTRLGDSTKLGVELHDFYFAPTYVEAAPSAAGRTLNATVVNGGSEVHTFTVEEVGVELEVPAGEERQIDLTIPTGQPRLVYYCRYHRDRGMQGALFLAGAG